MLVGFCRPFSQVLCAVYATTRYYHHIQLREQILFSTAIQNCKFNQKCTSMPYIEPINPLERQGCNVIPEQPIILNPSGLESYLCRLKTDFPQIFSNLTRILPISENKNGNAVVIFRKQDSAQSWTSHTEIIGKKCKVAQSRAQTLPTKITPEKSYPCMFS